MESFNQNVIKHKTGLLNLAAELGNVSKACRIMGFAGFHWIKWGHESPPYEIF